MAETIFALASGAGRAGVAVIRVSGKDSWASMEAIARVHNPQARTARYAALQHENITLDQSVILPFKAPASYTGEDVVEYHIHGGRAVIDSVLDALAVQDGHRMAEPGEFARRAFESGKLDLTEWNSDLPRRPMSSQLSSSSCRWAVCPARKAPSGPSGTASRAWLWRSLPR